MARFRIDGAARLDIASDNWMSALGEALARLGAEAGAVECDVLASGDIEVRGPFGAFVVHEIAAPGPIPRLGTLPLDLPPPSPLDAPDPTEARAWRAHEETSEDQLAALAERSAALFDLSGRAAVCAAALDLLMEYVPAESGAVLLADGAELRFVAARGPRAHGLVGVVVPTCRGLAGLTVRSGVATLVREATADPHHYAAVDRRTGYDTREVLSVPVRAPHGNLGCVQLLNPFAGTRFLPWHETAARLVAARISERLG